MDILKSAPADLRPLSPIDLDGESRKAMADQIATVGKQRLKSRLATLSFDDIRAVERAIRVQLSL